MKLALAIETLADLLEGDTPAYLEGAPGIAKSAIVHAIGAARGLPVYDVRLSMFDPVDLRGLPVAQDGETVWLRPGIWPKEAAGGCILFFDEFDRAAPAVQSAALQLFLDRRVGEHRLPAGVRIVAAGNGKSDRVGTNRRPDALTNRCCIVPVETDADAWCTWAKGANIDPMLIAFIRFRPTMLQQAPAAPGASFPSPRAWVEVGKYLGKPKARRLGIVAGLVSEPVAAEFEAFYAVASSLPPINAILANPGAVDVPSNPSVQYAVAVALARHAKVDNFGNVVAFLERMPKEFAIMAVKDAVTRDPALCQTHAYTSHAHKNQDAY